MFSKIKAKRQKALDNLENIAVKLYDSLVQMPAFKDLKEPERKNVLKNVFGENAQELLIKNNINDVDNSHNPKDICLKFFGLNENWSLWKNIFIGLLVQAPDIPSYFMPSFTQTKSTGDAKALKKGEGLRGILTGSLEGAAVGGLIAGRKLLKNPLSMIPYIMLGAGVQFISSKIFPYFGEKAGKYVYMKNHPSPANIKRPHVKADNKPNIQKPQTTFGIYTPKQNYNNYGLKI